MFNILHSSQYIFLVPLTSTKSKREASLLFILFESLPSALPIHWLRESFQLLKSFLKQFRIRLL